jgi:hypothetical protein
MEDKNSTPDITRNIDSQQKYIDDFINSIDSSLLNSLHEYEKSNLQYIACLNYKINNYIKNKIYSSQIIESLDEKADLFYNSFCSDIYKLIIPSENISDYLNNDKESFLENYNQIINNFDTLFDRWIYNYKNLFK